jgi:Ulp1 family protease
MLLLSQDFYAYLSRLHQGYDFFNVPQYIIQQFTEDSSRLLDDIIIPIHIPGHWILAIILPANSRMILIDSMHHDRKSLHFEKAKNILRWYNELCVLLKQKVSIPISQWTIISKSDSRTHLPLPLQTDWHSCGVFVAITAAYWIVHQRLPSVSDWTQQDIPILRLHMAATLFENERFDIQFGNQTQERSADYIDLTKDDKESLNAYDTTVN